MNQSEDRDEKEAREIVYDESENQKLIKYLCDDYPDLGFTLESVKFKIIKALKAARKEERGKALEEAAQIAERCDLGNGDIAEEIAVNIRQAKERL